MNSLTTSPANNSTALFELLDSWVEQGWLRALDSALARFFYELDEQASPWVLMATALASHQLGQGHVCLDLMTTLASPDFALSLPPEGDEAGLTVLPSQALAGLTLTKWRQHLRASSLVSFEHNNTTAPLVLAEDRLYLRRYWRYEQTIAQQLLTRLTQVDMAPADLSLRLTQLFPEPMRVKGQRQPDWQKLACALAAQGNFSLITGGPGTGKTTTVVRLLALLQQSATDSPLRIRLAAPTGKAAARLTESIGAQVASLPISEAVRHYIPTEVSTLHRLLGSLPNSRHFRHHSGHLLPLDVLVIDEASMIDLEMMACLLSALPAHARLILLGDKDQLASVEAGSVFGDLCQHAEKGLYTPALTQWLTQISGEDLSQAGLQQGSAAQYPLAQRTLMLRFSRRFDSDSGIGQLAHAVNLQQVAQARHLLTANKADINLLSLTGEQDRALEKLVTGGYGQGQSQALGYAHYLTLMHQQQPATTAPASQWQHWASQILTAFDDFRLLCTVRKGPWGVELLNQRIATHLYRRKLLSTDQGWYAGRPVLVTRNDYSLGLMNGDIGIVLAMPDEQGKLMLRVVFARNDGSGELKLVLPSRLSAIQTVFAMTVHKSQGSEFTHTALVLPDSLNPVLTKELLYTGITRARTHFSLIESKALVFEQAIARCVARRSGLISQITQHSQEHNQDAHQE